MRPIPDKIKKQLKQTGCIICGTKRTEQHHALIYAGKQVNEIYAIVPLCVRCHRGNNGTIWQDVKEKAELIAIKNGLIDLKEKYPKFDWTKRLQFLASKYE